MPLSLLILVLLATPLAAQTTHTVTVRDFEFDPATITVDVGDTVRWVNESGFHNVRSLTGPESFGNVAASAPWEYEFTFTEVATSTYDCEVHASVMQGSVTVTAAPTTDGAEPLSEIPVGLEHAGSNPFRETARLTLRLNEPGEVRVTVYDVRGRELAVLFDGAASAGETPIEWSPGAGSSAVYVVRTMGAVQTSLGIARIGPAHTGGH